MKVLTVYAHPNPKSFCHAILDRFTQGLNDAGHENETVDLYAINFDPVFRMKDYAGYVHEDMPPNVLAEMNLQTRILETCRNPLERFIAGRWMRGKDDRTLARFIRSQMPKDIVEQQEKVQRAEGLAFIAPVIWLHFPAVLKGWFERVFNYGYAFALTPEGWKGVVRGRVPLLNHEKALVLSPTLFKEEVYRTAFGEAMEKIVDDWGLRYPGVKKVEREYFFAAPVVDSDARQKYLARAYSLGRNFAI